MEQSQPPASSKRKFNKRLWLAILLFAAMLISLEAIFIFGPEYRAIDGTPTGSFIGTPQSQADGYKLTFDVVTPETKFADCRVVLSVNGTWQTVQTINVTSGNAFISNNITWTDLADDGIIRTGDSLVVSDPISTATYEVAIVWTPGGNIICSRSWTVP